jgi:hypothetical protein
MRKVIFLLIIILSFPTILWASDPIIGTWIYNKEKSDSSFHEETQIYKEVGKNKIEIIRFGIYEGGDKFSEKYTYPRQGGVVDFEGAKVGVELLIKPGEWYYVNRDGGNWQTIHRIISEDGKTMYFTLTRFDSQGNLKEVGNVVFDKK